MTAVLQSLRDIADRLGVDLTTSPGQIRDLAKITHARRPSS
jgi:hypothetical protein